MQYRTADVDILCFAFLARTLLSQHVSLSEDRSKSSFVIFCLAWASASMPCKRYVVREYLRHRASSLAHVRQNFGSARIGGGTVQHLIRCTWMLCPSGLDTCGRLLVIRSAPTVDTAVHHCPSAAPVYAIHITRAAQRSRGYFCSVQLMFNACSLPRMAPFVP